MEQTAVKLLVCFSALAQCCVGQGLVNVARGKSCTMSSSLDNYPASHAANGNTSGVYTANNCINTGSSDWDPWWEVDLGRIYPVYNITIYGRTGQLGRLSNTRITVDGVECHSIGSTPLPRQYSFTCNTVLYGQKVKISRTFRSSSNYLLNMCEFEVLVPAGISECAAGYWGPGCDRTCSSNCVGKSGTTFCYQDTGDCYACTAGYHGSDCSQACDVRCKDVCNPDTGSCLLNVALNQTASQSSRASLSGPAGNAVNGNTGGNYFTDNCIGTGDSDNSPSWQVDLGRRYPVYSITISNRLNFQFSVIPSTITVDGTQCYRYDRYFPTRTPTVSCDTTLYGQVVSINRDHKDWDYQMYFCEFQVWVCSPGYYGDKCDVRCINSHCLYCDQETGTDCYDQCDAGQYGNDCSLQCRATSCKNGQCDVVTGLCTQCDGNYGGSYCTDCARGFYGGTCDQSCSAGCPNSECDQQTGHCQPCNSSYWDDRCDKQCPSGCLTSQCHQQTGRCSSCKDGYWGDKCDQQCSTGCQNSQCDQQTGYCQPCRSGYWGDFCNETCLSSRCKNNQCNQADGLCLECRAPFFELPYCECQDGYYYNDTYCIKCPVQCYNTPCNKTTGHCDSCPPGRRGDTCSEDCIARTFGENCARSCGACLSGAACNTVTGECPGGCASGFVGLLCLESARDGMVGPIVGAIIGGMVFLGISIMVAACWIRRRHKLSTKDRSDCNTDVELKSANFPEACADEPKQSDANTDEAAYSEIMDTPNVALVDVTQKDDDDTSESGHYYSPLDGPRGERSVYTKPVFKHVPAASDNQDYANAEVSQSQVYVNTSVRDNSP